MERLLSLPGGAVNCTVLSRISLRYGIEPAMSSLRSHIEERTRAAQRQMLDAHSDAKAAHETGWIHWCTALLRAHFPSLAPPWVPQAGSTETSPNGASQLAALANGLPPAVSSHPEAFIWAFEQWQRPLKDAAQRNGDADVHSVAPLTQLFTDTPLAQALLAPCFRDAQTLDITRLPSMQVLDPCSGASAILLAAFRGLLPIFITRLGWSKPRAVEHLIQHTLRGVELDPLCASVGALVLALEVHRVLDDDMESAWAQCSALPSPIANVEDARTCSQAPPRKSASLRRAFGSLYNPKHHRGPETDAIAERWLLDASSVTYVPSLLPFALATPRLGDVASKWLQTSYTHVCTNVPFLARGKQDAALRAFCALHYPHSRHDLANVFLDRCLELAAASSGQVLVLMPQNWLFLRSYQAQRRQLLAQYRWQHVHFCKEGAFESTEAAGAFVILLHIDTQSPSTQHMLRMTRDGAEGFGRQDMRTERVYRQQAFLETSQARIVWEHQQSVHPPLSDIADAYVGLQTGDDPRYIRAFWEFDAPDDSIWTPLQGAPNDFAFKDGSSWLVRWEQGTGPLHRAPGARPDQGVHAVGRRGIAIQRMRRIFAYQYDGGRFHQNIAVIVPKDEKNFAAVQAFCHAPAFETAVRRLDQKLNVTNRTLTEVPFDVNHWAHVAQTTPLSKPANPRPFLHRSFQGHVPATFAPHIHLARYLGMRWPNDAKVHSDEQDAPPPWYLLLHPAPDANPQCTSAQWMRTLAKDAEHTPELRASVTGNSTQMRQRWLRDSFFKEHCELFLQRPFLWHIWDGEPDGFGVIVRYHRLDADGLSTLIDGPLASWRHALQHGDICSEERTRLRKTAAAERLHARLSDILAGRPPYDLYIRWKPPEKQPDGWKPDLNDGVRLNLRPFMSGPSFSQKGAGVLRLPPKVYFRNDRGRDDENGPWSEHNQADGLHPGTRVNSRHRRASGGYCISGRDA